MAFPDHTEVTFPCDIDMGIRAFKRGGGYLNAVIDRAKAEKRDLSGEEALGLFNTYGLLPRDLTILLASHGLFLDHDDFLDKLEEQKKRFANMRKCKKEMR